VKVIWPLKLRTQCYKENVAKICETRIGGGGNIAYRINIEGLLFGILTWISVNYMRRGTCSTVLVLKVRRDGAASESLLMSCNFVTDTEPPGNVSLFKCTNLSRQLGMYLLISYNNEPYLFLPT
jgi:hypothetical protein